MIVFRTCLAVALAWSLCGAVPVFAGDSTTSTPSGALTLAPVTAATIKSSGIPNCGGGNALASYGGGFACMTPAQGAQGNTGSQGGAGPKGNTGPSGPQGPAGGCSGGNTAGIKSVDSNCAGACSYGIGSFHVSGSKLYCDCSGGY